MKNPIPFFSSAAAFSLLIRAALAVEPSPLFADHAVLQSGRPVPVWGTGAPGEKVTVCFKDISAEATTGPDGSWKAELPALKAGDKGELIFEGANKVTSTDVLVGDVWLCSGQSNMEWNLDRALDAEKELAVANYPEIRHFKVAHVSLDKPVKTLKGEWVVATPATAGKFSAVGYFFATYLQEKNKMPIGLLDVSWGGSPIETWLSAEALASRPELAIVTERWTKYLNDAYPQLRKDYDEKQVAWKQREKEAKAAGKPFTDKPLKAPDSPGTQKALSGGFNGVTNPVIPYALKGILWYQGEHNTVTNPTEYAGLLETLAADYRAKWNDPKLPFLYVQLANYRGSRSMPRHWAIVREQQQKAQIPPPSGLTTAVDIGNPESVHPLNKREVGRRLSLLAFEKVYGNPQGVSSGPVFKEMVVEGNRVRLKFETFGSPLVLRPPTVEGPSFEVSGADQKFQPATAVIDGSDVIVQSDQVAQPAQVRYLWFNTPAAVLFNQAGLPAFPFRTDHWPEPVSAKKPLDSAE